MILFLALFIFCICFYIFVYLCDPESVHLFYAAIVVPVSPQVILVAPRVTRIIGQFMPPQQPPDTSFPRHWWRCNELPGGCLGGMNGTIGTRPVFAAIISVPPAPFYPRRPYRLPGVCGKIYKIHNNIQNIQKKTKCELWSLDI